MFVTYGSQKLHYFVIILTVGVISFIIYEVTLNKQNETIGQRKMDIKSIKESNADLLEIKPFECWDRKSLPFPCVHETNPDTDGIFYIKVPKTGSSTLAQITTRFAARESKRQRFEYGDYCKTHNPMTHAKAYELKIRDRNKSNSFLWTGIRHPNSRAISRYGMLIETGQAKASVENFIFEIRLNLDKPFHANFQLDYLSPERIIKRPTTNEEYKDIVQNILDEYNFISIYERLDESLVVLSMILGMGVSDVLYQWRPISNTRCDSLESEPSWITSGMREYLETEEWKQNQKGDFMFYDAANEALDATIEKLGRDVVERKMKDFQNLIKIGTELSNMIHNNPIGCGVLFPSPYSDIDELTNFDSLNVDEQRFISSMKMNLYYPFCNFTSPFEYI